MYEKFHPMMARVLLEGRYKPVSEEVLLKAFKVRRFSSRIVFQGISGH